MTDDFGLAQFDLVKNLLDNLPAGYTNATVKKPNAKFTTPKDNKWLRITVIPGAKNNVHAGGQYKRTFGLCVIDVFYPKDSGDQTQLADVKLIQALYENLEVGNAKCLEAEVINAEDEGIWYNQQVNINFYFEGQ